MPLIERINQMQKEGLTQDQISQRLQEEGAAPKDINEALEQNQVKAAVGNQDTGIDQNIETMQPSVMPAPSEDVPQAPISSQTLTSQPAPPIPQAPPAGAPMPQQMPPAEAPIPQQPLPTEQAVPEPQFEPTGVEPLTQEVGNGQGYYQDYQQEYAPYPQYQEYGQDTDITAEIAEQVVNEKFEKIAKQLSEAIKLKTELQGKTDNIDERLRRIELIIDRLQSSIINKIGDYGRNIADLKEEMTLTQESFSKILNPLTDNIEKMRELRKPAKETKTKKKTGKKKTGRKKKGNFEKYLRK